MLKWVGNVNGRKVAGKLKPQRARRTERASNLRTGPAPTKTDPRPAALGPENENELKGSLFLSTSVALLEKVHHRCCRLWLSRHLACWSEFGFGLCGLACES